MLRPVALGLALGLMVSFTAYAAKGWQRVSLDLGFRDSVTGVAVVPDSVWVERLDEDRARSVGTLVSDPSGRTSIGLGEGRYRVFARAQDGGLMAAETEVRRGQPVPDLVFNFDPTVLPPEADPKVVSELTKPDAFLATGFVVDDETGQPVSGLSVVVGDQVVTTGKRGEFLTYLPLTGMPSLFVEGAEYGDVTYSGFETWPGGDIQMRIRVTRGANDELIDLREERRRETDTPMESPECDSCDGEPSPPAGGPRAFGPALPKSIRVGRNCGTATTCTSVEVYTVQTYTARVLSSEWYGCWGSVTGGMDAMRAGAVAVRSYGVYHVYTPRTSTYDICDTTSCQVFGTSTNTNSLNGTNDTVNYVLTTSTGAVARSEYSAENNNSGCGDGFTGTGSSAPCIADPVCTGFAMFGHGRGLCQWGSARWATQKRLSSSQACTSSAPATGQPRKDWVQIISHYYTTYNLVLGASLDLTSVTASPASISAGGSTTLTYNVTSTADINNVWLIATISLNGTGTPVPNAANQVRRNLTEGPNTLTRTFATSASTPTGPYSIIASMLYDRNNSGTVNTGDFLMADRTVENALTLNPSSVLTVAPVQSAPGSTVNLTSTLVRGDNGQPIANKPIQFSVDGTVLGTFQTNASGIASTPYTLANTPGSNALVVTFSGDGTFGPANANTTIWRVVATSMQALSTTGRAGTTVALKGSLLDGAGAAIGGRTVQFLINGSQVGTGTTDPRGIATFNYAIPAGQPNGSLTFTANHPLALPYQGSQDTGMILVTRRP